MRYDVIIVGAGQAGSAVAAGLRQSGFDGSVLLIGDEPHQPYERPPLSKGVLLNTLDIERCQLRPLSFWADKAIELCLGTRVVAIDSARQCIQLDDGGWLEYGQLVWAAGGHARRLTLPHAEQTHVLRTLDDALRLKAALQPASRIVVIGGGFIGLESAAALAQLGHSVTVIEQQPHLLSRVSAPVVGEYFLRAHTAHGVDVVLNADVDALLLNQAQQVNAVLLADGQQIDADIVLAGIGFTAATEPLAQVGLASAQGVLVDEYCQTTDPHIFAVGDCALSVQPFARHLGVTRVESVQNAMDQARTVVKTLLGNPEPYAGLPWFWSDQYDIKFQTVGISTGYDQSVLRGDPHSGAFSVVYLREGRLQAIDCINQPRDFSQARALLTVGFYPDPLALADASTPLKQVPQRVV